MRQHSVGALIIFGAFFLLLTVGIIFSLRILLWPVLIGFVFSFILDPLVDYFESKDINRTLVISILFVLLSTVLLLGIFFVLQPVIAQVQKIMNDAPAYAQLMQSSLLDLVRKMEMTYPNVQWMDWYERGVSTGSKYWGQFIIAIPKVFSNAFGMIASVIIVPFVTFFLLKDGTAIKKQLVGMVPNRYFEMSLTLFEKVHDQIRSYLRGILIDSSIVAVLYAVGYSIIQVKYGVFLGMLAGIATLIPYLGPWLTAVVPIMIMLFDPSSPFPWWSVIVVVVIVQFIENNFIYPLVLGRSVEIHPLIIMFGLFVGGKVGGLMGMVLAVPTIAVVKGIAEVLYKGFKRFSVI